MLLLLTGTLTAVMAGVAGASPRGQLGPTSSASIAISVSVRPQVRLSEVPAADASGQAVTAAPGSARDLCLFSGSGNYSLLMQPSDAAPGEERFAALAKSDAATTVCRSVASPRATSSGFRLPTDKPPTANSFMLLIAPE
jgi:hypothetical protein